MVTLLMPLSTSCKSDDKGGSRRSRSADRFSDGDDRWIFHNGGLLASVVDDELPDGAMQHGVRRLVDRRSVVRDELWQLERREP